MHKDVALVPPERIERSILLIRGQKVILARGLAYLYGVPTKVLNQAVKRNRNWFSGRFHVPVNNRRGKNLVGTG
jgi:hypothetical protein